MAPPPLMPVPFKVMGLLVDKLKPFKSSAAPALTVTDCDAVKPQGVLEPSLSVPALIFTAPLKVELVPDKVSAPVPFLFRLPRPVITPDNVRSFERLTVNEEPEFAMLMVPARLPPMPPLPKVKLLPRMLPNMVVVPVKV